MSTIRQYGREDVEYHTWYSDWSKRLARQMPLAVIQAKLGQVIEGGQRSARQHLAAIAATTSMHSQSQRRAQTRNVTSAYGEERFALQGALEIHELFPEHAHPNGTSGSGNQVSTAKRAQTARRSEAQKKTLQPLDIFRLISEDAMTETRSIL